MSVIFGQWKKIVKYFLLAMNEGNISTEYASGVYETCYKNMTNNIPQVEDNPKSNNLKA